MTGYTPVSYTHLDVYKRQVDVHDRAHMMELCVPLDYPQTPPKLTKVDLPDVVVSQIMQVR